MDWTVRLWEDIGMRINSNKMASIIRIYKNLTCEHTLGAGRDCWILSSSTIIKREYRNDWTWAISLSFFLRSTCFFSSLCFLLSSQLNFTRAENFMTGYRMVFDRENLKLGWSRSNCKALISHPNVYQWDFLCCFSLSHVYPLKWKLILWFQIFS